MLDLNAAFPQCATNRCLDVENAVEFKIIDTDEGRSTIYRGDSSTLSYPYFTVINPHSKAINFLAIDNCIYFNCDGKKCDFALYDESVFCLVEIKSALGSASTRRVKRKEAIQQLRANIVSFKGCLDFGGYKVEACICVGYKVSSPRSKASNQSLAKDFIDNYDVELFEGNEMIFN